MWPDGYDIEIARAELAVQPMSSDAELEPTDQLGDIQVSSSSEIEVDEPKDTSHIYRTAPPMTKVALKPRGKFATVSQIEAKKRKAQEAVESFDPENPPPSGEASSSSDWKK